MNTNQPKDMCIKCMVGMLHPFHDNGTINEPDVKEFTGINWFEEEQQDRERIVNG